MPMINQSDITDVRLGTVEAGALLAGDNLIWNRRAQYTRPTPGEFFLKVPEWASFFTYIIAGGGAGGGSADTRNYGTGGSAGEVKVGGEEVAAGTNMTLQVGAGGSGARYNPRSSRSAGSTGNETIITYNKGTSRYPVLIAYGGSSSTGGVPGQQGAWLDYRWHQYLAEHLDDPRGTFQDSRSGSSYSESGRVGGGGAGGGAGGRGGGNGGAGGDGYAQVVFFGVDPLIGGSVTPPPRPEPEPPTQGGHDRGSYELGVTYQAGDVVTIGRGEYPAAAAEGTYRALITHESSFYHYPWNDPRTWERIN